MFKHSIVFNSIKEKIVIGGWYEGMLIPSESQLCEMYDVSRITIRRALKELEYSGFVRRIQGKGTFVKVKNRDAIELTSSVDNGLSVTYDIVECKNIAANSFVARKLHIGDYENVLYIKKIRKREGKAEAVIETWCPNLTVDQIEEFDLKNKRIIQILTDIKKELIDSTTFTITPIIPEEWVCKTINVEVGSAQAMLNRISVDSEETPCEYTRAIINSNDLEFTISSWVKKNSYKGI